MERVCSLKVTEGPFSVYELLPNSLYQRGKLHGLNRAKKQAGLEHYGITHVVALAPNTPDPGLPAWGVRYTHLPIPDGLLHTEAQLLDLADQLAGEILDAGTTVLTLCNAGRNRSGLLSALIVRECTGMSGSWALEFVRLHRPNALANEHFEKFLRGLA